MDFVNLKELVFAELDKKECSPRDIELIIIRYLAKKLCGYLPVVGETVLARFIDSDIYRDIVFRISDEVHKYKGHVIESIRGF